MRSLALITLLSSYLFSGVVVSYERTNEDAQAMVSKIFSGLEGVSLSPAQNEAKALYELKSSTSPTMALCYSNTIDGIKKQGGAERLLEYMMITPLLKGELHVIVRAGDTRFKSINDLERHNVGMGLSGTALNLMAKSLFVDNDIGVSEFNYELEESMGRLMGGGLDAVVAIGQAPIGTLKRYEGKFKLLNVASVNNSRSATIPASSYGLSGDVMSIASDLLLIGKKDSIAQNNLTPLMSKLTRKLISHKSTNMESICSNNGQYPIPVASTLASNCTQYQNELVSSGKKEVVVTIDLLRVASRIEDIEIYMDALSANQMVGGLSNDSENAKLKQVFGYFQKHKESSPNSKLLIKSFVGSSQGDAYSNAQVVFKYLQKSGISRGDMVIKSFNQDSFCLNPQKPHCNFLNRKVIFEFVD
ncbi:MAG: hypothetical protein KN64_02515 [Sulfurovum sp. AS07-7]|nr:MAG: hypothetical protein KN64_02515 [Sulfurovum sp. AS07-7]